MTDYQKPKARCSFSFYCCLPSLFSCLIEIVILKIVKGKVRGENMTESLWQVTAKKTVNDFFFCFFLLNSVLFLTFNV